MRRAIRAKIVDEYPALEDHIDDIIPKKASMLVAKWCASAPWVVCGPAAG